MFSIADVPFYIPTSKAQRSISSVSLPILFSIKKRDSHPSGYEVASYGGLDLLSPTDQ